jgi:hypothetical protein
MAQKVLGIFLDYQEFTSAKLWLYAAAPLSAWGLSHAEINEYLQTGSMGIGILVGLFALVPLCIALFKKCFKKCFKK